MGGWNPVADVVKTVENVVKETGKAVSTVGQVTSNVGSLVGGDVGKAINAVTNAPGASIQAVGDVIGGDIKGAAARQTGAYFAAGTAPIAASSTLKEVAKNDTVSHFTLGFSNDASELDDSSRYMIATGDARARDISAIGRFGLRTAAVIGTAGALNAVGSMSGVGSTAASAGTAGLGFLKDAAQTAGTVKAFAKDPVAGITNYLGVDTDLVKDIRDIGGVVSRPTINRQPTAQNSAAPILTENASLFSGFMPIIAVSVAGLIALILILKKR